LVAIVLTKDLIKRTIISVIAKFSPADPILEKTSTCDGWSLLWNATTYLSYSAKDIFPLIESDRTL